MVIQVGLLVAVQLHPTGAVTSTVPFPPDEPKVWLGEDSIEVQVTTVKVIELVPILVFHSSPPVRAGRLSVLKLPLPEA